MNVIEVRDLVKHYGSFTLDHLNLTLPEGCILGLIGENGAGKSTTIRLILNMIRKDGGSIALFGRDHKDNLKLAKEDIGVVMDEVWLPECLTVAQINAVMKNIFRSWEEDTFWAYVQNMSLPKKQAFKEFSKGMKMKLGIAIALSHRAKLLILDEATSGLDPVARDEVVRLIGEFTREESHAVLISSHIVSDLEKICDYIAFLHKGRLLLCEEKDRLLEEYGFFCCTREEMELLPKTAVFGKRVTPYGAEVLVRREDFRDAQLRPVTIEELFVFMVKEAG